RREGRPGRGAVEPAGPGADDGPHDRADRGTAARAATGRPRTGPAAPVAAHAPAHDRRTGRRLRRRRHQTRTRLTLAPGGGLRRRPPPVDLARPGTPHRPPDPETPPGALPGRARHPLPLIAGLPGAFTGPTPSGRRTIP